MLDLWKSLDNKSKVTLVTTLSIAVVGWIIAIWQFKVANRLKKKSVVFEQRLKIYNEYFHKIDDINERLMIDFQEFIGPIINKVYSTILLDPENSNQALVEMQSALTDVIAKSSKTLSQTTEELQQLRFIASKKTLSILDDYKKLAQSQTNSISDLFGTIDINQLQNYNANDNEQLKIIGQKLIFTRDLLEKQMREDLGIK